jgi:predicted 2-oxoglutarate/Fe(II)-dependent dioxygenase YbiX
MKKLKYEKSQILSDIEISVLNEIFEEIPENQLEQEINLRHIDKRDIDHSILSNLNQNYWFKIKEKIEEYFSLKTYSHYFLEYNVGSSADKHLDDLKVLDKTIITLLYQSDDLDGGETIVYDDNDSPLDLNLRIGESLSYEKTLAHSVNKLRQGKRRVLVSWLREHQNYDYLAKKLKLDNIREIN